MFGLRVFRHRQFESNIMLLAPAPCSHKGLKVGFDDDSFMTVAGHGGDGSGSLAKWKAAMGVDFDVTKQELSQAIPPAYSFWLGRQLLNHVLYQREIESAA